VRPVSDPAALVNPMIGTGSGNATVGQVDTFPGAAAPFGMLTFSPDTPSRPDGGGYNHADDSTLGFSLTHMSGPGCSAFGDFPILPTVGAIGDDPVDTTDAFSHSAETATPGSYGVTLNPSTSSAIQTKLAATARTGIAQLDYPSSTSSKVEIRTSTETPVNLVASDLSLRQDTVVTTPGSTKSAAVAKGSVISKQKDVVTKGATTQTPVAGTSGLDSGAWVSYDTTKQSQVTMKVAISYVSQAGAQSNLNAEDPGWSESSVAKSTYRQWDQLLDRVRIGGGTNEQQVNFYTALYHALLEPSIFSDDDGDYIGFDNDIHRAPPGQTQYANFSGWDIYRSEIPLLAVVAPQQTSEMATSLLNDEAQGGWLPKWGFANDYTQVMNGDAADPIIAEAYAFGARDFNVQAALAAMVKGASTTPTAAQLGQGFYVERPQLPDYLSLGYVPNTQESDLSPEDNGASETLEYASADFAIGEFAADLGQSSTASTYLQRSQNWTNIFNVDTGYIQPRDGSGGGARSNTTVLDYTMTGTPDETWGAAAADAPPSYPSGTLSFPPGREPTILTPTGPNLLGATPTAQLDWQGPVENGVGSVPGTITPTTTSQGASAVEWTETDADPNTWIWVDPPSEPPAGQYYQGSVTLQGTGAVYLDFWNGEEDLVSATVQLTDTPQTLTVQGEVPDAADTHLQIRTADSGPVDLFASDASVQLLTPELQ
jgi:predicted alpha-1,2-mannosidase